MAERQTVERRYKLPRGWRDGVGPNESAACPHRDLSVCVECQTRYADRIVDVLGAVYWYEYDSDRDELRAWLSQ